MVSQTTAVCKASEQILEEKNIPEMELNKKDMKIYVNLSRDKCYLSV